MKIHQFHPSLAQGDAVSNHVFALRRLFREWGYESHAYAIEAKPGVEDVLPYRRLFRAVAPDDLLVLHFSIGNEVFDQLVRLPARRALVYHNITPPEYFQGINPYVALFAERGLKQLATLAPRVELAIGVSEFNRRELEAAGFKNTAAIPILIDWSAYDVPPDPNVERVWRDVRTKLLFVSAIRPNKRHDDLIRMLAYYHRCIDREAHLLLVGSQRDQPQYCARLRALVRELGLEDAVTFTGPVSQAALVAYYRQASCFVSLSEHEGFAVWLLEAMRFGVPIVAYDAGAVGETLDGGGLLIPRKDLAEVAEACALLIEREDLRQALAAAAERRLEDFSYARVAARTREVLAPFL